MRKYAFYHMGIKQRLCLCFFAGLILGTVFLNYSGAKNLNEIGIYSDYFIDKYSVMDINKLELFKHTFFIRLKETLIVIFFNLTIIGPLYSLMFAAYKGITTGMLISAATIKAGMEGVWLYIASVFPHYFIYVPMLIVLLLKSHNLNVRIYKGSKMGMGRGPGVRPIIFDVFILICLMFFACLLEAWVETYINSAVLQNVLKNY